MNNDMRIVQLLLDEDVDVTFDNNTPLMAASRFATVDMVQKLVQSWADVLARDEKASMWAFNRRIMAADNRHLG